MLLSFRCRSGAASRLQLTSTRVAALWSLTTAPDSCQLRQSWAASTPPMTRLNSSIPISHKQSQGSFKRQPGTSSSTQAWLPTTAPRRRTSSRTLSLKRILARLSSLLLMVSPSLLPSTSSTSTRWRSPTKLSQCSLLYKTEERSAWFPSSACWMVYQTQSETTASTWGSCSTKSSRILSKRWNRLLPWSKSCSRWRNGKSGTSKSRPNQPGLKAEDSQLLSSFTKRAKTSSFSVPRDSWRWCQCTPLRTCRRPRWSWSSTDTPKEKPTLHSWTSRSAKDRSAFELRKSKSSAYPSAGTTSKEWKRPLKASSETLKEAAMRKEPILL